MGLAAFEGPNLFILDEPTNHLDIDSREALIHALNDFPGAVILISHDRHLIEATADRLWLVKDGTVKPYDGDLADYRQRGDRRLAATASERREADKASKADRRREAAQRRAALEPLAKEIRATEALMDRIRKRIDAHRGRARQSGALREGPDRRRRGSPRSARSSAARSPATRNNGWRCRPEYEEGIAE